jgi:DNA polymerase-4
MADTTSCIAASYEAKAFGVKTGTRVGEAKKMCPGLKLVEADHANYIRYHHQIVEAAESCLPVEAVCSIDEIACRLTGSQSSENAARELALKIKEVFKKSVGTELKCSIGIAPNRYLAKIAADMQKPDGLTVLRMADLPQALFPLKLRDLPGVGSKMEARLNANRIYSMQKLCSLNEQELQRAWGSVVGGEMYHLLRGENVASKDSDQKSIGHSHVLPPSDRNDDGALKVMKKLTDKTAQRLRKNGFWASRMELHVRFLGQDSWKASASLVETQDTLVFMNTMKLLWKELPLGSPFAVGISFSGLKTDAEHTPSLFDDPKREKLTRTLDQLNEKFGKSMVHFGATHESESVAPLRIAFTRIPDISEIE